MRALILFLALTGCTSVTYTGANGESFKVTKVQIVGEDLSVDGTLDGIGTLSVNKQQDDAQELLRSLIKAASP